MKKRLLGIDILRGLGIFILVAMHSAFYYFGGLFDLDLNDPPMIVTIIGFLLMFAGLFAMISGLSHFYQFEKRLEDGIKIRKAMLHQIIAGIIILIVAYVYFLFTGPGLADFASKSFDNSFLVELIRNGRITGISMNRLLYVDSLVMIGMNIILCAFIAAAVNKLVKNRRSFAIIYFLSGSIFFLISIVRIPLYDIYINALDNNNMAVVLSLNWLVNKNNPIFPFLAFGLLGMCIASLVRYNDITRLKRNILPAATIFFITGIILYIFLPDTMLQRNIDLKWYSIMLAQIGLFSMMITGFIYYFDVKRTGEKISVISRFFNRFGVAGLTVFFLESVVSACIYRLIRLIFPQVSFTITQALIYGFSLAIMWGLLLILWEKVHYKYGIEYFYAAIVQKFNGSTKGEKLRGE